jgi:hypothetical protein
LLGVLNLALTGDFENVVDIKLLLLFHPDLFFYKVFGAVAFELFNLLTFPGDLSIRTPYFKWLGIEGFLSIGVYID